MPEEPRKESNGSKAFAELSDEISCNDKLISDLQDKLNPVIVPIGCDAMADVLSQDEPPCSSLVNEIKCFKNRLNEQNKRLSILLENIDI